MNKVISFALLCLIVVILISPAYAQVQYPTPTGFVDKGIGLGAAIAVVASWSRNESILWAILHGILSWFYVIYFVITRPMRQD